MPRAGDTVTIAAGRDVVLDVSPPALRGLTIDGKLSFANNADLELISTKPATTRNGARTGGARAGRSGSSGSCAANVRAGTEITVTTERPVRVPGPDGTG